MTLAHCATPNGHRNATASHRPPKATLRMGWRRLAAGLAACLAWAAPAQAAVMISQVYGGGGNSGAPYASDFVELHNSGAAPVSVAGWTLQYASTAGTSWTSSTTLAGSIPAGGYYLVRLATGSAGANLPTADAANANVNISATAGKLALVSTSTIITSGTVCPIPSATVVDFVGYGSATNCSETTPAPAPSNTTAIVRASVGNSCLDSGNNSTDFSASAPNPRNTTAPAQPCGGTGGGGGGGGTPTAAAIYTIQGSGATSPLAGQPVITSGVVTNVLNNGFFMQDLNGDGNPATSDGIFVFTSTAPPAAAAVGNLVQVTGTVVEFASGAGTAATPLTEIGSVTAVTVLGTGYTIAATPITLPLAAGDTLERFEGMLVRITTPLLVQQNYFQARYGQLTLGVGRHETPTNRYRPGTPQAIALADLQARSRLLLDDDSSLQNTNPTAFAYAGGVPRAGDTVGPITGTLDFGLATSTTDGAGLYRIQPTVAPVFSITNPRSAAPPAVGGNVRLASMNVLNFFTTFTNGQTADGQSGAGCSLGSSVSASNCRGADSLAEFTRQRAKIVQALAGLNADAVGLMEIQNNGNVAAQNLVDALNTVVGAGIYAPVALPAAGTGTDAIRVAMIYKTSVLTPVGAPLSDPAAINNRPPLAQAFVAANGERVTLLVNHLKSKSSCPAAGDANAAGNTDSGDGQGCWNAQRVQQAQQLRSFVAQVQAASGSNDVMLVGDFNAYAQEDPIYDLTSNSYVDQLLAFNSFEYSYVFDGQAGYIDHAITTASMAPKVASVVHWHIDADESLAYDYNLEFKQPACATCAPDPYDGSTPYRASDHDPVLLGLNLYKTLTSSNASRSGAIVGTAGDDIIIGGAGPNQLLGNGGSNIFVYTSMNDAGDTILDFTPGVDRLDLRTLLAGLGWAGTDPVAEGYVRFSAVRGGSVLEVDVDGRTGASPFRTLALLRGVAAASIDAKRDLIVR